MRRLLVAGVTILTAGALWAAGSSPALARGTGRVPPGVRKIVVSLTFLPGHDGHYHSLKRVVVRRASVRAVVRAADRLTPAVSHGVCPQFMRLGPDLEVLFKGGPHNHLTLAQARVQVTLGARGDSGASACFPIVLQSRSGGEARLVGNGFVRLVGRVIGTAIS